MKKFLRILSMAFVATSVALSVQAQGRPGGNNGRSAGRAGASVSRQTSRPQTNNRAATMQPTRNPSRPGNATQSARPATNTNLRPGQSTATTRPANQGVNRPGQTQGTRPCQSVNPGNNRPGQMQGTRPGQNVNPGNNRPGGTQPGFNRPSTNRPGSSVSRPGGWSPVTPPHNNWASPSYRPPRPGGGYWGSPAPNNYRIRFWVPPMPPRYTYATIGVPTLGTILGLTFGSFIDAAINSLYTAGYNVAGYYDNVIYLNNVTQLGLLWPEVTMNYTDGLLTSGQFSYYTSVPGTGRYNAVYSQLCGIYGSPVSNTGTTATWWAGDNTGYITLHYAYTNSITGIPGYYTTLTYSVYY